MCRGRNLGVATSCSASNCRSRARSFLNRFRIPLSAFGMISSLIRSSSSRSDWLLLDKVFAKSSSSSRLRQTDRILTF